MLPRTNDERRAMLIEAIAAQGLSLGAAAVIAHAFAEEAEGLVLGGRKPRSIEWCSSWVDAIDEIADCARGLVAEACDLTMPSDLRRCALYRHWPARGVEVGLARVHPTLRPFAVGVRRDAFDAPTVCGPAAGAPGRASIPGGGGRLGARACLDRHPGRERGEQAGDAKHIT